MITLDLSPEQRRLARQALGLNQTTSGRSYRNRYLCMPGGTAYPEWMRMVEAGLAGREQGDERLTFFWLTRCGAEAVLEPGERLCPEDFPADA